MAESPDPTISVAASKLLPMLGKDILECALDTNAKIAAVGHTTLRTVMARPEQNPRAALCSAHS